MSTNVSTLLGDELKNIDIKDPFDVIRISQKRLTKSALIQIGKVLALGHKDLAEMSAISLRTFQRYKNYKN